MTDSISSGKKKTVQTYGATYGVCTGFLALAGSTEDEEDDGGPLARYELRLSVQWGSLLGLLNAGNAKLQLGLVVGFNHLLALLSGVQKIGFGLHHGRFAGHDLIGRLDHMAGEDRQRRIVPRELDKLPPRAEVHQRNIGWKFLLLR